MSSAVKERSIGVNVHFQEPFVWTYFYIYMCFLYEYLNPGGGFCTIAFSQLGIGVFSFLWLAST